MGFRINYIAAKCSALEMAKLFPVNLKPEVDEMPDGEPWLANIKASGWSVMWFEDETFISKNREVLEKASEFCDVIACDVNETSMWSAAEYLRAGEVVWKLTHSGDSNIRDLYEEGAVPADVEDMKSKALLQLEAEGDAAPDYMFEVPLDAANSFIQFRHDKALSASEVEAFIPLERKYKQSFFESFFGLKK